jgi:hypothetical protein
VVPQVGYAIGRVVAAVLRMKQGRGGNRTKGVDTRSDRI